MRSELAEFKPLITGASFWDKIIPEPNSGCWLWVGHLHRLGYGVIGRYGKAWKAHRWSWEINKGTIPRGKMVLHTCDIRCCVNPDHLFIGTQDDNMKDAARKGRIRTGDKRGSKNGGAVLTEGKVLEIRKLYSEGWMQSDLYRKFKVSPMAINRVVHRKAWNHV